MPEIPTRNFDISRSDDCWLRDHSNARQHELTSLHTDVFQVTVAQDIEFANRMAVLAGDFLLANACTGLARLGSTHVVQLIANAISHLMEARCRPKGFDHSFVD